MSDNELMSGFIPDADMSIQQILNSLMSNDINLEMKTEIKKPQRIAAIKSFTKLLNHKGLELSSETLVYFIREYLTNMVSYNREGRREVIKALVGMLNEIEKERAKSSPLTTNLAG